MRHASFLTLLVFLAGCAQQPPATQGDVPGFFMGLVHGLIALVMLAASLFWNVRMYAFPNSGFGYEVGFAIGFVITLVVIMLSVMARIGGFLTRSR
jgi:hypothetical protein